VTILPVSSALRDLPLFRVPVRPGEGNGLREASEIMVDKAQTVPREQIGPVLGRLDDATLVAVTRALALFLGLG
jgi:mRNA interferase MazF